MDSLYIFYAVSILLLIIAKLKADIKIYRVLALAFLSILVVVFVAVVINIVYFSRIDNALDIFIVFLFVGTYMYLPLTIFLSLFIKLLEKYNVTLFISALLGTFLGVCLFYILEDIYREDLLKNILIILGYFVSIFIDNKIFKGDK